MSKFKLRDCVKVVKHGKTNPETCGYVENITRAGDTYYYDVYCSGLGDLAISFREDELVKYTPPRVEWEEEALDDEDDFTPPKTMESYLFYKNGDSGFLVYGTDLPVATPLTIVEKNPTMESLIERINKQNEEIENLKQDIFNLKQDIFRLDHDNDWLREDNMLLSTKLARKRVKK